MIEATGISDKVFRLLMKEGYIKKYKKEAGLQLYKLEQYVYKQPKLEEDNNE